MSTLPPQAINVPQRLMDSGFNLKMETRCCVDLSIVSVKRGQGWASAADKNEVQLQ